MKLTATVAAAVLGAMCLAPSMAAAQDCSCSVPLSSVSAGTVLDASGDVRVLQAAGFTNGAAGQSLPVGSRVIVGPQSSAAVGLGDCALDVPAGASAGVASVEGNICVRLLDSTTTAQTGTNGPDTQTILLVGGGIAAVTTGVIILSQDDNNPVSQ